MKNSRGVGDVLKFGIQTEKDSILLYTQLVISSKLPEAKDAFRRLLKRGKAASYRSSEVGFQHKIVDLYLIHQEMIFPEFTSR